MAKKITMVEMGQVFDRYITMHFRTKTLAAEYFGVKSPRITLICQGKAPPSSMMLMSMGYERVDTPTHFAKLKTKACQGLA